MGLAGCPGCPQDLWTIPWPRRGSDGNAPAERGLALPGLNMLESIDNWPCPWLSHTDGLQACLLA